MNLVLTGKVLNLVRSSLLHVEYTLMNIIELSSMPIDNDVCLRVNNELFVWVQSICLRVRPSNQLFDNSKCNSKQRKAVLKELLK